MSENGSDTIMEDAEPSMEDILASIRRIISEDEEKPGMGPHSSEVPESARPFSALKKAIDENVAADKAAAQAAELAADLDASQVSGLEDILILDEEQKLQELEIPRPELLGITPDAPQVDAVEGLAKNSEVTNLNIEPLETETINDVDKLELEQLFEDEAISETELQAAKNLAEPVEFTPVVESSVEQQLEESPLVEPMKVEVQLQEADTLLEQDLNLVIEQEEIELEDISAVSESDKPVENSNVEDRLAEASVAEQPLVEEFVAEAELEEAPELEVASVESNGHDAAAAVPDLGTEPPLHKEDEIDAILKMLDKGSADTSTETSSKVSQSVDAGAAAILAGTAAVTAASSPSGSKVESLSIISDGEDMDVVKSLMADLTQPPPIAEKDDDERAIIEEIIELSIESETEIQSEIAEAAGATDATGLAEGELTVEEISAPTVDEIIDDDSNALLELAAEAEQEAADLKAMPQEVEAEVEPASEVNADEPLQDDLLSAAPLTEVEVENTEGDVVEVELSKSAIETASNAVVKASEEAKTEEMKTSDNTPEEAVSEKTDTEDLTADEFSSDKEVEEQEIEDMAKSTARKETISSTIVDEVTRTASSEAFASLSMAIEEKNILDESGPRIGDIVQDALRPMLKDWLDENLKDIVERTVAKEVKRIASGK